MEGLAFGRGGRGHSATGRALPVALVLGVPVDDVTMEETLDWIFELAERGRRDGRTHQIATVNVDFVVNAVRDSELGSLMRHTSLSIPDGMPIVWGSRLLGSPLRTRVAGADLIAAIVERAASTGASVALYGAAPGVAERTAELLRDRVPGARLWAAGGPTFRDVDELAIDDLESLRSAAPDICCVAFGNPKQERFIARFGSELGIPVMIGVGGSLDFLVGEQHRAPTWMQRSGLEWLHRAVSDPQRLAWRYVSDAAVFFPRLARQAWSGRASRREGAPSFRLEPDGRLVVDLSTLRVADNRSAGAVVAALRTARRDGTPVSVRGARASALETVPGLAELVAPHQD